MFSPTNQSFSKLRFHGTTILAVRGKDRVVMAGDGQVTLNNTVVKHTARKVRRIYNDTILVGFAGATADALTLTEKLEQKLERYNGNLTRSAVELARDWRADKYLRRLEALMIAVDGKPCCSYRETVMSSNRTRASWPSVRAAWRPRRGHGPFAATPNWICAAKIVEVSMKIAASLCVFTNDRITIEEIES
jgi:ATP-dependent HslUV protease subunit HslV